MTRCGSSSIAPSAVPGRRERACATAARHARQRPVLARLRGRADADCARDLSRAPATASPSPTCSWRSPARPPAGLLPGGRRAGDLERRRRHWRSCSSSTSTCSYATPGAGGRPPPRTSSTSTCRTTAAPIRSDSSATQRVDALFYNNLGDRRPCAPATTAAAFVYLLKALRPGSRDRGRLGQPRRAVPAQRPAGARRKRIPPRAARRAGHKPAMSNLAQPLRTAGPGRAAEAYAGAHPAHQQRNPYYHLHLAERAYAEGSGCRAGRDRPRDPAARTSIASITCAR
jgi:hypothetical protein